MAVPVAFFALGLMAYVPGRYLSRLLVPAGAASEGRLLVEMLLGNAVVGLIGLALAEAGVFSLPLVLAGIAVVAAIAFAACRGTGAPAYGRYDAMAVGVVVLALLWLSPPFETILYANDSSVYASGGLELARHGRIPFFDPTLEHLSIAERSAFFPPYLREGEPPYSRLTGGLLLTGLTDASVLPAFHHLLSVWVALSWAMAGDQALAAPAAYFGALALWSVTAFALRLGGPRTAAATAILLATSVPQYWYSRFLMPEVPSQYFLWAGLVAASASFADHSRRLGIAAGIGFGLFGMMRLDGLAHIAAALALWKGVVGSWPAAGGFVPAFAVVAFWASLHQILFPTHYYAEALAAVRRGTAYLHRLLTSVGIAGLAMTTGATARLGQVLIRAGALLLVGAYVIASIVSTPSRSEPAVGWLITYVGIPTLMGALAGAALWLGRARNSAERFALLLGGVVLAQVLYDPRVSPAALWAIRRFVPVAIPALLVSAALVVAALAARRRWLGVLALVGLLTGTLSHNVFRYRGPAFHGTTNHLRAIAAEIRPGGVLAVDPTLAVATQLHIAVWAAADVPTYLVESRDRASLETLRAALKEIPLYWLGTGNAATTAAELRDIADPVASYTLSVGVRRMMWDDPRDDPGIREESLLLYRFRPKSGEEPSPGGALH